MRVRRGLAALLSLLVTAASAAPPQQHRWQTYRAQADLKVEVCYPADLLRVHHDQQEWDNTWLMGPDGGEVLVDSRSEKYTTLSKELNRSIDYFTNPYPIVKHSGDDAVMDYSRTVKIIKKTVRADWYIFTGENKKIVVYSWRYYVDHAFKGFDIIYPKSNAAAWAGIPERMRACFKSLGPITNPNLQ